MYHRPDRGFPPGPPLFGAGKPAAKVAGVSYGPPVLSQELARFPAGFPTTGLLTFSDSRIRPEITAAKMASLEHLGLPQQKRWRSLYRMISRKKRRKNHRRPQNARLIPSGSAIALFGILFTAAYKEMDVPRSSFCHWYRRYLEQGYDGLRTRSKRGLQIWNAIPEWEKQRVVEVAREYPEKSCREIAC